MPPNVTIVREIIGSAAHIKFGNTTYKRAGGAAVKSIVRENVVGQRQADGSSLKRNANSTVRQKRRKGRPPLSLIDSRERFAKISSWVINLIRNGVVIHPKDLRVSEYVQRMGYTGWMRPGRKGREAIRKVFVEAIDKARKKAAAKRKREVVRS